MAVKYVLSSFIFEGGYMDINSKEFKERYDFLFKLGYCKSCIGIMTSNNTNIPLCKDCEKLYMESCKKICNREKKDAN